MNKSRTREELKSIFLDALKEPQGIWHRGWKLLKHERNTSGIEYKGINQIYLSLITSVKHYNDNRWFTFNQVRSMSTKEKPVHVRKGEHGYPVEKWLLQIHQKDMDKEAYESLLKTANDIIARPLRNSKGRYNSTFEFHEAERIIEMSDISKNQFDVFFRNYVVFNASQIEGLKPTIHNTLDFSDFQSAKQVIENYMKKENIKIIHSAEGQAYYSPMKDVIVMPNADTFNSEEEYLSTLAHECCHSTGHPKRIYREIINPTKKINYAIEELRAELSSVFLCNELGIHISDAHIENHKSYIQSWVGAIESDDGERILNSVFKDVYEIVDYVKERGGYESIISKNQKQIHLKEIIERGGNQMDDIKKIEELLRYFSLKYDGRLIDIYNALSVKERIDESLKQELFQKVQDFQCVTMFSKEYPECLKKINNPPICLYYKGDISMMDKNAGTLQLVNLDNHTRTFNVIDMENGDLLIAYESYNKAVELNHMMDEKREHVKAMIMEYNKKNAQYELLHSKSMLDCCSELDVYKHEVEINKTLERLMPYNDVPCDVIINYKDLKHKDTINEVMTIEDFFNDRIERLDFKNGVDFKLDKDNDEFIVICYGNAYEKDGRCHHEEVNIRLKMKDEHKSFNKIFKKKSQSKKAGIKLRR